MSDQPTHTVACTRTRHRALHRLPLAAALLCALAPALGHGATITVTSASDAPVGGQCTIHDAIEAANTNAAVGGCAAGSGADTIAFAAGVNDIVLSYGLYVTQALTLQGSAARVTLRRDSAAEEAPVIQVDPEHTNVPLHLVRVAIRNGRVPVSSFYCGYAGGAGILTASDITLVSSEVSGNMTLDACASGGGIEATGANVSLTDSVVKNNSTSGAQASGGGIHTTGTVTLTNSEVSGNTTAGAAALGGGVFAGTLTLSSATLSDNHTTGSTAKGGGASATSIGASASIISGNSTTGTTAAGGGVSAATITLSTTLLSSNSTIGNAAYGGGARATSFDATGSTISGNSTTGPTATGGGVFAPTITLSKTTLSGNHTSGTNAYGGGANATSFDAQQSTISGNWTTGNGAGGGGVVGRMFHMYGGTLSGNSTAGTDAVGGGFAGGPDGVLIENATVSSNTTAGTNAVGAGIGVFGGTFGLLNSTVTGNLATLALGDGVYAQNDSDQAIATPSHFVSSLIWGNGDSNMASGTLTPHPIPLAISGSNNLIGNLSGTVTAPAGTLTCNPQLQPLADNGGLTHTHALGAGSCAINVGSNSSNFPFDQRGDGFVRVSGPAADIGAFEAQPIDRIFKNGFDG
ncbi:MAG: choice-of-anchor Q domain-containing protein [Dokdonella sp.]